MITTNQYPNARVLNMAKNTIYDIYVWLRIKLKGAFLVKMPLILCMCYLC